MSATHVEVHHHQHHADQNVEKVSKLWTFLVQICVETESRELEGKDNQDIDGENRNRRAKHSYMIFVDETSIKFTQLLSNFYS